MKRRRSGKLRRRSHRSYSRSREELDASREKLGFAHQESRMNQAHNQVCGRNACQNTAAVTCEFCKRQFCREHSTQILVESHAEVTNLTNKDYRDDPELYNKRINDWNRRDGHPCSSYTGWWLAEHSKKMEAGPSYKSTYSRSSPTYSAGYTSNTGHVDYAEAPRPQARPDIRDPRQEGHPSLIKTSTILVAIAVVIFIFFVVFYEPSQATGTGTTNSPYNANRGWQGAGYYSLNGKDFYAGSISQLNNTLSTSTTLPPQFLNGTSIAINTTANLTNTTTATTSTSTTVQPTLSGQGVLYSCVSNVNSDLAIAQDRLPSGTSISIVNQTVFYYNITNARSISNVNSWIHLWNSGYSFAGDIGCGGDPEFYACEDAASISGELNVSTGNISSGSVIGAGVAVRFDFPPQAQSNGFTEVSPILCNAEGQVMAYSDNYLRTKNFYS